MRSNSALEEAEFDRALMFKKIFSAIGYSLASFTITVVNKTVLTTYAFPSYQALGLGQMVATITVLWCARQSRVVSFPPPGKVVAQQMGSLPLIYLGNMMTGLGGTKELSLPMYTALRRFGIPMTMFAEQWVLGVQTSLPVKVSVYTMVGCTLLTAVDDVTFSFSSYALVLLNDAFAAANSVFIKKKLDAGDLGKYGLMYYNALFTVVPAACIAWLTGDLQKAAEYPYWNDSLFLTQFLLSCVMGLILSYSVMMCTEYNSALTTNIIGCLKNAFVTYVGMIIGGDYVYSFLNFVLLSISVMISILYTYVTFKDKPTAAAGGPHYAKVKFS